jgi:hypothetical protein
MLDKATKYKAVGCANKSLHFLQQLKKHVQIGDGFTQARAAYGLMLIEAYLNGQFLTEVQEFTGHEDETNENGNR